ncbi:MAG TPA: amidohydrolase family protein [Tepidisphaeraceae bacterium]|jgi:predicted TIM-barrel fold metal-dependent hydrolase|nr:amidohydrolase family protein [Tepidisphaeraceae bacterium]
MILDVHVHISATTPDHGSMSPRLLKSVPFRFMRWKFGIKGADEAAERALEKTLADTIAGAGKLDAAVVLAFDAVHDQEGRKDDANTHLYVTNDYVIELAARHKNMLFGCSVHPYRKDAVAEIERCVAAGAVLLKWLPIVQNFNPADRRCIPFYEALAHHKLPLLSHTGGEKTLPSLDMSVADPNLLLPAIERGVTVIAAHCGTRSGASDIDFLPAFVRLATDHEHFYGDTSALNLPTRSYAWKTLLADPTLRSKIVHGSDWPIPAFPPVSSLGIGSLGLLSIGNWMRRDVAIKERLGLDDDYWHRAAKVLGIENAAGPRSRA